MGETPLTNHRKYLILDTRAKAVAVDAEGEPLRFADLEEAKRKAIELRGRKSTESFAVLDDIGNRWLWSKKGVLRVTLSMFTQDLVYDAVKVDYNQFGSIMQTRCSTGGIVETSHQVRLPDGPPIPVMHHGRPWSDKTTTERWTEKPQWFDRGPLLSFIGGLPTRIHKLEQQAMNAKAKALRAEQKRRMSLAAYEAGEEMTCQICARLICSKSGYIAHHGYLRPGGGSQTASCSGAQARPFEVSNLALIGEIDHCERTITDLRKRVEAVRVGAEPVVVNVQPHWSESRRWPRTFSFTAETYDVVRAKSEGHLAQRDSFDHHRRAYIAEMEGAIRSWGSALSEYRKRNAGWKQTHVFGDDRFKKIIEVEHA
jgi:hypothetical protein